MGPKDKGASERRGTADLRIRLSISEIAFSPSVGRSLGRSFSRPPLSENPAGTHLFISRPVILKSQTRKRKTGCNLFYVTIAAISFRVLVIIIYRLFS